MEQRHYGYQVIVYTTGKAYSAISRDLPEAFRCANEAVPADAKRTGVHSRPIITEDEYNRLVGEEK